MDIRPINQTKRYMGGNIRRVNGSTDADRLAGEYHGIIMLGYFTGDMDRMVRDLTAFYSRVFSK